MKKLNSHPLNQAALKRLQGPELGIYGGVSGQQQLYILQLTACTIYQYSETHPGENVQEMLPGSDALNALSRVLEPEYREWVMAVLEDQLSPEEVATNTLTDTASSVMGFLFPDILPLY